MGGISTFLMNTASLGNTKAAWLARSRFCFIVARSSSAIDSREVILFSRSRFSGISAEATFNTRLPLTSASFSWSWPMSMPSIVFAIE